jgi:hypothetical protein
MEENSEFFGQEFFIQEEILDVKKKEDHEILEEFKKETNESLERMTRNVESMFSPYSIKDTQIKFKKRKRTDNDSKNFLLNWINEHEEHPYPNEDEKIFLQNETNMTRSQLNNWFINARRRYLKFDENEKVFKKNINQ